MILNGAPIELKGGRLRSILSVSVLGGSLRSDVRPVPMMLGMRSLVAGT